MQVARTAHASQVVDVLRSLWDATGVPEAERAPYEELMASESVRLHARSLDKVRQALATLRATDSALLPCAALHYSRSCCRYQQPLLTPPPLPSLHSQCLAEVKRLEAMRTQQMLDLINAKAAELRALCSDSHLEEPTALPGLLAAVNDDEARPPGWAAEQLAKLLAMLAEVRALSDKRATLLASVCELHAAAAEDEWLQGYETDEARYRGRDANKRLQRAIRASKLRERLPAMLDEVRTALGAWRCTEGVPFLYDGVEYEFEVLEPLAGRLQDAAASRATKAARAASARRQSNAGAMAAADAAPSPARVGTPRNTLARQPAGSLACNSPAPGTGRRPCSAPVELQDVSSRTNQGDSQACGRLHSGKVRPPHPPAATPPAPSGKAGGGMRARGAPSDLSAEQLAAHHGGTTAKSRLDAILHCNSAHHAVSKLGDGPVPPTHVPACHEQRTGACDQAAQGAGSPANPLDLDA